MNFTAVNFDTPASVTGLTSGKGQIVVGGASGLTSAAVGGNGSLLVFDSTQGSGLNSTTAPSLSALTVSGLISANGGLTVASGQVLKADTVNQTGAGALAVTNTTSGQNITLTTSGAGKVVVAAGQTLTADTINQSGSGALAITNTTSGQNITLTTSGLGATAVSGNLSISGSTTLSALTASLPLQLDGNKAAISAAISLSGTGVTGLLPLANGGSNANLTASNGGVVWSNASQMQILAGTATAGQFLLSGATATPSWSNTVPNVTTFSNTTNATTLTTGAVVVSGGMGIGKDVWIGGSGTTSSLVLGNVANTAGYSGFQHSALTFGTTNYAIVQDSVGQTNVNAASGHVILFAIAGGAVQQIAATLITMNQPVNITGSNSTSLAAGFQFGSASGTGSSFAGGSTAWSVQASSNMVAPNFYAVSDARLKKNVKEFAGASDIVRRLRPVRFTYREERLGKPDKYGFLAQDVAAVIPSCVHRMPDFKGVKGCHTVDHLEFIPILVKSQQEMLQRIEKLEKAVRAAN